MATPRSSRPRSGSYRSRDQFRFYLKEWRIARRMTQQQLASKLKTSKGEVSRYERGERTISLLIQFRLARALRISPGQLFSGPNQASADALLTGLTAKERQRYIAALEALMGRQ